MHPKKTFSNERKCGSHEKVDWQHLGPLHVGVIIAVIITIHSQFRLL